MRSSICKTLHTCVQCKQQFYPKRTDRLTCCSRDCGHALIKARVEDARDRRGWPATLVEAKACTLCAATFWVRANSPRSLCSKRCDHRVRYVAANADIMSKRPCPHCGVTFDPTAIGARKFCSTSCNRKAVRKRQGSTTHRARARKAGVEYQPVDPFYIMNRDGWRCQICRRPSPERLRGTIDPRAPELDHIVPLALKGPHTADNLQCACRSCNLDKGGQRAGQRLLFG